MNDSLMKRSLKNTKYYFMEQKALPALIILLMAASLIFEVFLTPLNLNNIFRQVSITGLVAIGMTIVLLTGGIDLSVGSVAALAGVTAAYLSPGPLLITITVPLMIGAAFGLLNGFIVTKMKIPPFISTLATMLGGRGLVFIISKSETVRAKGINPHFSKIARGYFLNLPYLGILLVLVLIIVIITFKYRSFGRRIYAVGGNEEASRMMGLKVDKVKILAYTLSGILAGAAGMLLASRLGSGQPYAASGWEMTAISAAVIGGTLPSGGVGSFTGTLYGILILGIITNIINLFGGLPYWYANLVTSILLLIVILLQSERPEKLKPKKTELKL